MVYILIIQQFLLDGNKPGLGVQFCASIQYSTFSTSLFHNLDDKVDVGFGKKAGGDTRFVTITKTVGTVQVYTNQGAPVKVCILISLRFNMEQIYTLFPVLSSDKFNVSNFTKKMSYIFTAWPAQRVYVLHFLNGTIHQQT